MKTTTENIESPQNPGPDDAQSSGTAILDQAITTSVASNAVMRSLMPGEVPTPPQPSHQLATFGN